MRRRLPDRQLIAGGIAEMEPASAGKRKDRFGDRPAGLRDSHQRGFEITHFDDGQRHFDAIGRRVESQIDVARRCRVVDWAEVSQAPTKLALVKRLGLRSLGHR